MSATRVIIADDHPLFRAALREALRAILPGLTLVEADSLAALQSAIRAHPDTDLVLLDLHMPGVRGFASLIFLRGEFPAVPVVMVSGADDPAVIRRALDFGASGFIPKSVDLETLRAALGTVLAGGIWQPPVTIPAVDTAETAVAQQIARLSPQQFRVLMMLAEGRLNKQIADALDVSESTVKAHITGILRKLKLRRRTQAAVLAERLLLAEAAPLRVRDEGDSG